ncbi:hypothetical protein O3M35_010749 [Rhynocoris fuscipes]|uniref:Uncharacterized protein n=1 Tax=Rhynocoris fuscipes TaxID=488301 RepID=A0AAW1D776_9HEMI
MGSVQCCFERCRYKTEAEDSSNVKGTQQIRSELTAFKDNVKKTKKELHDVEKDVKNLEAIINNFNVAKEKYLKNAPESANVKIFHEILKRRINPYVDNIKQAIDTSKQQIADMTEDVGQLNDIMKDKEELLTLIRPKGVTQAIEKSETESRSQSTIKSENRIESIFKMISRSQSTIRSENRIESIFKMISRSQSTIKTENESLSRKVEKDIIDKLGVEED